MNISLLEMPSKTGKYTYRLLHNLIKHNQLEQVSPDEADIILLSVDDIDDLSYVRNARRTYPAKKIICGGFDCFQGEYLLKYCDALVVGEGFEFFEALKEAGSLDDILCLDFILTKEKSCVIPSVVIDTKLLPIVRLTEQGYYYLAGRGCKGKCTFCCTGFVYPNWHNTASNILGAHYRVKGLSGHNKITFITNDTINVPVPGIAQSVRVDTYLQNPSKFKSSMLHFGIEGFSENRRRSFYKFISDDKFLELINILGERRQNAELFFIIGLPGTFLEMMDFAEKVPISTQTQPIMKLKLTYLNPSAHTPLWSYNMASFEYLTDEQIRLFRNTLASRNTRFRMFQVRSAPRSLYRGIMHRATWNEIDDIEYDPKDCKDIKEYIEFLSRNHRHLLTYDKRPMPASQIVTPFRRVRDKMARRLGMDDINYKCDLAPPPK